MWLEDKCLANSSLLFLLSDNGTESSKSITNPSAFEVSAFEIQSSLLAGTKRGQTGNRVKPSPNQILLRPFFLFQ